VLACFTFLIIAVVAAAVAVAIAFVLIAGLIDSWPLLRLHCSNEGFLFNFWKLI